MKKQHISIVLTSILLSACSGEVAQEPSTVTTSTTTSTPTAYSISGTVPGTLIEAICKDGSKYSVYSTDDNTSEHPFTLTIPKDLNCKLIMTTNEKDTNASNHIVTALSFNDLNSSYFALSGDTDIGNIPLRTSGVGGVETLQHIVNDSSISINKFTFDPLDEDNDGIPNIYEDDDNDGAYNKDDDDDDGDGILDTHDDDHKDDTDGDGISNAQDLDDDGDGIEDSKDDDKDNDGQEDSIDEDDDNDGINDSDDDDDNNDGINDDLQNTVNTNTSLNYTPVTAYTVNDGRLLGANCAQCHGTNGNSVNSWDSIAGESNLRSEFYEDDDPLMSAVAHGFTTTEVDLIGNWLSTVTSTENEGEDDD